MGMLNKKSIKDIDVAGKKAMVRVDFNVPLDADLKVTDDSRILGAVPTIRYLVESKAAVILISHLGRPKGGFDAKLSLKPAAARLSDLMKVRVSIASDVIGPDAKEKAASLKPGQIMMLENVRFHKEEEENDPAFAKELASMADVFVNDAFGTAHRAHASTAGIAEFLPSVCGMLIQKELSFMGKALSSPEKPFVAILGGAKVSDKIGVIENLLGKVDTLIIGGGMAYTFLKAKGYAIGNSICEDDKLGLARKIMDKAESNGVNLLLPVGSIIGKEFKADTENKYVPSDAMPDGWIGMDIGNVTIEQYTHEIRRAKTIVWNGPMGVFEFPNFAKGTKEIARAVAESGAVSIVGGGDSVAAVEQMGFAGRISHISTGGGASLEFLEGKELPGIACLKDNRGKIIAGNWKMNKLPGEAAAYVRELAPKVEGAGTETVVIVPYVCIPEVVEAAKGTSVKVGAQNVHYEEKGAYTGEVSAQMLLAAGVEYALIGHSERREYFGETDGYVNRKALAALKAGLKPIVCVGESLEQRELGVMPEILRYQVKRALQGVTADWLGTLVIAYEPIWAIGTGKTATAAQANEACSIIRKAVKELYGVEEGGMVRIQYGGSVTAANAGELFGMPDIDGGLVGGASLKSDEFARIVKFE